MKNLFVFLAILFFMLVIDIVWIKLVMQNQYSLEVGNYLRKENGKLSALVFPALVAYVIMALGLFYFIGLNASGLALSKVVLSGAILGLVIYSTFALTNYSILKFWTLKLVFLDIGWGIVLGSLTSFFIKKFLI